MRFFNGVSVAELERRARALDDKTQDPEGWRMRSSSSGFLGQDESLLQVLEEDARLVASLGTSCEHLAQLVEEGVRHLPPTDFFVSGQRSLFYNEEGDAEELQEWSHEWRLQRGEFSLIVTPATARWIRKYGFFQGRTAYRADPRMILAVLQPDADLQPARQLLEERRAEDLRRRQAERQQLLLEWDRVRGDPEADAFFQHQIDKLDLVHVG